MTNQPAPQVIDVDELMNELRRRVEDKKRRGLYSVDALAVDASEGRAPFGLDELERLRAASAMRADIGVHPSTKPVVGRLITKVKTVLVRITSQPAVSLMHQGNAYNGHLLGYLAGMGREVTRLGEEVTQAHDAVREAEIDRERDLAQTAGRTEEIAAGMDALGARLTTMEESLTRMLALAMPERLARIEATDAPAPSASAGAVHGNTSPVRIALHARPGDLPVAVMADLPLDGPVLLLGAGTGEVLEHLGPHAAGVEPDPALAEVARLAGRAVTAGDPVAALAQALPQSLNAVVVTDVVEHLDAAGIAALSVGLIRSLVPDGRAIVLGWHPAALLDPDSGLARDARMPRPLHPETLRTALEAVGLVVDRIDAIGDSDLQPTLPPHTLDPIVEGLRADIDRIAQRLLAAPRYVLHARRP